MNIIKNKKIWRKKEQGVTLIALIITIIVLFILASISIYTLSGDNGILKKTTYSRDETDRGSVEERLKLVYLAVHPGNNNGYTKEELEKELQKEFGTGYSIDDSNTLTWVLSANGYSFRIPAGKYTDKKTYTISYNSNEGTGTIENQVIIYDQESNLYENTFTREGYKFTGWNTRADGTGDEYLDTQRVLNIGDSVLYAQWKEITTTTLKTGQEVNNAMKSIAKKATNITHIKKEDNIPEEYKIESNNISLSNNIPVYIWYSNGVINYYSEADEIYLNEDSSYLFDTLTKVKDIEIKFKTDAVKNMFRMFYSCNDLENIDLSTFNTTNVTNMSSMFGKCLKLKKLDLGSFNTQKVTSMDNMFNDNNIEELNVTSFNTENLKTMSRMFSSLRNLKELDVSSFNTSKVTNMEKMFDNMAELTTIYASDTFVTNKVTKSNNMFINDTKLVGGNGTKYNSEKVDKTYAVIDSEATPGYFTSK